jgi:transposase
MEIDPNYLPTDPEALKRMVVGLVEQLAEKQQELRQVQHLLEQLLRWRYGQKRERIDENQLFLFAASIISRVLPPADSASPETVPAPPPPAATPAAPRKGHGRQHLPSSLERRRVVYDLGEGERQCPHCRSELRPIGEEVSERLEYVPASCHVIEEACRKYACPHGCTVVTAMKPAAPIEKGLAGPGLLAHIAVSKYGDHAPLHRQEGILQRQGVQLSRKTMCDWMRQCAELARPLYQRMKQRALSTKVLQTDDTPVAVLDPTLPRTRTGRIWTYVANLDHPYTVYDYTPNRSRDGPDTFLKDFRGFLQADAYSGYDHLYQDAERGVIEVACWAHSRRRFFEAQSSDVMRSTVMLAYIRLLYDVEREAKDGGLNAAERLKLRRARSLPILADIKSYLEAERPNVLPKSPEGQAIAYTLSNWEALVRYCSDGDLAIDNNAAELSLRGIVVGRRNWMFYGSDNGGRTAAVLTSLIATCKRLRVDPFAYLRDVFARISTHPQSQLDELLPDRWQAARAAITS